MEEQRVCVCVGGLMADKKVNTVSCYMRNTGTPSDINHLNWYTQ